MTDPHATPDRAAIRVLIAEALAACPIRVMQPAYYESEADEILVTLRAWLLDPKILASCAAALAIEDNNYHSESHYLGEAETVVRALLGRMAYD